MKTALVLVMALVSSCSVEAARADGLTQVYDEPEVMAPAPTWTGLYGGVTAATKTTKTEGVRCYKLGVERDCNDSVFVYYPEYLVTESYSEESSESVTGAFLGYRKDFGQFVGGIEAEYSNDYKVVSLQGGLDLGKLLVYAEVGQGAIGEVDGTAYGLGADLLVGNNLLLGASGMKVGEESLVTARIGWKF